MPIEKYERPGTQIFYGRGTIKIGEKSRSVYESSGIRKGTPRADELFDNWRIKRETEIQNELLYGKSAVVTWTQAAASRLEVRALKKEARRVERRRERQELEEAARAAGFEVEPEAPEQEGDDEAQYVLWITDFFRGRTVEGEAVSERPLRLLSQDDINAYFKECHIVKGHGLAHMTRVLNSYLTVMNHAADPANGWVTDKFPRPSILPKYEPLAAPVNKWLYPEEIVMLIDAANTLQGKAFLALLFGTGRRGGELPWLSRSRNLILEPGHERLYLGVTKNGDPIYSDIPPSAVATLKEYLASRTDNHDALFLTQHGAPYRRPRKKSGSVYKSLIRGVRQRVAQRLETMADEQEKAGQMEASRALRARAAVVRRFSGHWGRHNAASHLIMNGVDNRIVDDHLGWRDPRSSRRYRHLSKEKRQEITANLDFGAKVVQLPGEDQKKA